MILFVDDDYKGWLGKIKKPLKNEFDIICASSYEEALNILQDKPDIFLILLDLKFGNDDLYGLDKLPEFHKRYSNIPVIMLTVAEDPDHQIHSQCAERGAYYYFVKDRLSDDDSFLETIRRLKDQWDKDQKNQIDININELTNLENADKIIEKKYTWQGMVFASEAMKDIVTEIEKFAPDKDNNILITGETGVGKEYMARAIHNLCFPDSLSHNFVPCNIAEYSDTLLEDEMFGHKRGAFTGAINDKKGLVHKANNGTLFLDEIGELSLEKQTKFLRVIDTKEFTCIGNEKTTKSDFRLVSATNKNIGHEVATGSFRLDFYHRICDYQIYMPPLRERINDIYVLLIHFIINKKRKKNKPLGEIDKRLLDYLSHEFEWMGNIRQLESFIARLVTFYGDSLEFDKIPAKVYDEIREKDRIGRESLNKMLVKNLAKPKLSYEIEEKSLAVSKHNDEEKQLTELDIIKDYVKDGDPEGKLLIPLLDAYLKLGKFQGSVNLAIEYYKIRNGSTYKKNFKEVYKLAPQKYLEKLYNEGLLIKWKEFRDLSKLKISWL